MKYTKKPQKKDRSNPQTGFRKKNIVIDAHQHMVGRLASVVAKLLLQGHKVVVLRCEDLNYSGCFARNRINYLNFLHKRCNVNPLRGPFHQRSPSKIFSRTVRGMLPIKILRGKTAYMNLKTYEGIPPMFVRRKRMMVPEALRVLRIKPGRKYCVLGRLSHLVGWKHQSVIATLEAKRKVKGEIYAKKMTKKTARIAEVKKFAAKKLDTVSKIDNALARYGY